MPPKQDPKAAKLAKKEQRKAELERNNQLSAKVKAAYAAEDVLAPIAPFKVYNRNDLNIKFEVLPISKLSQEMFQWVFNLLKANMEALYNSAWGWSDSGKRGELREDDALYLIARDANDNDKAVGFCHFRFEYDQQKKDNVLYVYELQVEESVRGKGLGQWMMKITELLALKYEMPWLLLTVFTENHKALHFYKEKLNYLVDELSPKPFEDEGYEILSKCFKR